jgi:secreted trypsin-like serine protease
MSAPGGLCGGTIIDETHIITAAHCVYKPGLQTSPKDVRVFAGRDNMFKGDEYQVGESFT